MGALLAWSMPNGEKEWMIKKRTIKFYDKLSGSYDEWMNQGDSKLGDETAFVLNAIEKPCKLLDMGCGNGRIAKSLKELGYTLTCLDMSEGMIEQARKKKLERVVCCDFDDYRTSEKFQAIISMHAGFSYINDKKKIDR